MAQCRVALRTLGLDARPHASTSDIKEAYLRLARKHHPDSLSAENAAARAAGEIRFKEVVNAYEKLLAPKKPEDFVNSRRRAREGGSSWINVVWRGPSSGFKLWLKAGTLLLLVGMKVANEWGSSDRRRSARGSGSFDT